MEKGPAVPVLVLAPPGGAVLPPAVAAAPAPAAHGHGHGHAHGGGDSHHHSINVRGAVLHGKTKRKREKREKREMRGETTAEKTRSPPLNPHTHARPPILSLPLSSLQSWATWSSPSASWPPAP